MKSEYTAKLGIDNTQFNRGLQRAKEDGRKVAGDLGKKFNEQFGAKNIFSAAIGAVAGGTQVLVQKAGDMLGAAIVKSVFGATQQGMEAAAAASDKIAAILDARAARSFAKLTPEQQEKELRRRIEVATQQEGLATAQLGAGDDSALQRQQEAQLKRMQAEDQLAEVLGKKRAEEDKKRKAAAKELLDAQNDLAAAEKETFDQTASDLEKKKQLEEESLVMRRHAATLSATDPERIRLTAQAIRKENEARQLGLKIAEDQNKADEQAKKNAAERAAKEMEIAKLKGEIAKREIESAFELRRLQRDYIQSQKDLAKANRDRVAGTLEEIAAGERGNRREQGIARRANRVEERARRAFDRGDEAKAAELLREADNLRGSLAGRTSSELDPLKANREAIDAAKQAIEEFKVAKVEEAEAIKEIRDKINDLTNALK